MPGKFKVIMIAPVTYLDFAAPSAGRIMEPVSGPGFFLSAAGNGDLGLCRPPGIWPCPAVILTGDPPGSLVQSAVRSRQLNAFSFGVSFWLRHSSFHGHRIAVDPLRGSVVGSLNPFAAQMDIRI